MSGWRDLARRLGVLPPTDKLTKPTKPPSDEVLSVLSECQWGAKGADPALARELFEERAAIREHDGGMPRAEAEAAAVHDVARALGISAAEVRTAVAPSCNAEKGLCFKAATARTGASPPSD